MEEVRIKLGFTPRAWQAFVFRNILRFAVLVVHRRGGKTLLAIMKLIHEALKCPRERGQYAYIAPELKQAKGIAWDYLKAYATRVPGAIVNESELSVKFPVEAGLSGAKIRLFGADNPNSLRGYYFDGAVVDEVAQMKMELWGEVLLPALADRQGWVLFIGTPHGINLFSKLYFDGLHDATWFAKSYTYLDTKALPEEEVERMRASMTPSQFKQEMLCDFGASDDNALIPQEACRAAVNVLLEPTMYEYAPRILGVDVAWTGGDRSVVIKRQGLMSWEPKVYAGIPEKTFANNIATLWNEWRPAACFVDVTGGYGGEVLSRLQDAGYDARGVKFSWKPSNEKFLNLRAEMWFKMAEWVKGGAKLPNNETLIAELSSPTYANSNAANRLQIESKDDIKKRLGFSPDMADALALTHAFEVYQEDVIDLTRGPEAKSMADVSRFRNGR